MSGVAGGATVDDEKKRYQCPRCYRALDFEEVCWWVSAGELLGKGDDYRRRYGLDRVDFSRMR